MQALWTVLGVGALLAGVVGYIWYKIRHAAGVESAAELVRAEVERKDEQVAALQAQIEAKNEQERAELNAEVAKVLAEQDQTEKRRRALELLARIRGVH